MAHDSFSNLTPRVRSKTISDIFELIKYYGQSYSFRSRVQLTKLSLDASRPICWIKDHKNEAGGVIITDPKYVVETDGVKIQLVGHIISNARVGIEPLVAKTLDKLRGRSFVMLASSKMGEALDLEELGLTRINYQTLDKIWPNLAKLKTNYFNVNETLISGLSRKKLNVFFYIAPKDYLALQAKNSLPSCLTQSKAEIVS